MPFFVFATSAHSCLQENFKDAHERSSVANWQQVVAFAKVVARALFRSAQVLRGATAVETAAAAELRELAGEARDGRRAAAARLAAGTYVFSCFF